MSNEAYLLRRSEPDTNPVILINPADIRRRIVQVAIRHGISVDLTPLEDEVLQNFYLADPPMPLTQIAKKHGRSPSIISNQALAVVTKFRRAMAREGILYSLTP